MSKVHITANIKCPLYKYETAGSVIHCFGGIDPKGSTNEWCPNKKLRRFWVDWFCKNRYKHCPDYIKNTTMESSEEVIRFRAAFAAARRRKEV